MPRGTAWEGGAWGESLGREIVDRRLWGLCGLFESRVCGDRQVARGKSLAGLRGEGTIGACVGRAGTWRNVEVFRVRIEVGDELVLEDAAGFTSDVNTGEEVAVKDVVGELRDRGEEGACFSGGGCTSSAGPVRGAVVGSGSGVEGNETEDAGVVVTCNPLGTVSLVISRGRRWIWGVG